MTDLIVIGAGPAGLMAAEMAAAQGAHVSIADAMPSVGRKFLMAGKSGLKEECLDYIKTVWTDMRPLSLSRQMDADSA